LRTLPPLSEACAGFSGFAKGESSAERIFELLAAAIQRYRRSKPQAFYAMRDVAKFFGVALTTVARVYRRLDREGVLTLVRSSQSIVAARTARPRFAVRGVICMPIWLPGFLYFLDWRKWFSQLEEELSRYHFVLEPIFYKADEETHPAFVDRVLRFNPDYVLWSWPSVADLTTIHSIIDAGVPFVSLQNTTHPFPGRTYYTSYENGLRRGLREWEKSGKVDNIVVSQSELLAKNQAAWHIRPALKTCSLPYRFKTYNSKPGQGSLLKYLQQLAPGRRTGVIFYDDLLYARLCATQPEAMLAFLRQHHVMVTRQITIHLSIPRLPSDLTFDALLFPWKKLARRIALDLSKGKGIASSKQVTVEAEWRPQIPVSEIVNTVFDE